MCCLLLGACSTHKWSTQDTWLETAYLSAHCTDWAQTRTADYSRFHETNPVLGDYPSSTEIDIYFITTGLLHILITDLLPPDWRSWWQGGSLLLESIIVGNNLRIGFGF